MPERRSDEFRVGDPTNPFHRASFYIEQMKYGPGPKSIEGATYDQFAAQLELLLREAGIETMSGSELVETLDWYGRSFAHHFRMHPLLAKSIFCDGVMHGIAFAAGLSGEIPAP
jgi:hypothetical protein